jgi:hypothetical protein
MTMGWFGPSKEEVWRQLCREIGAEFVAGGFWKGTKAQARAGPWTITLDTFTVSSGESSQTFTRLRAPFVNPGGFRFTIYRKGLFSELGKLLGMQDIEVGHPEFDEAFIIQGNDEFKVLDLFADAGLRSLALAQPRLRLSVKDDEGWFRVQFPEGVDELYFQAGGVIKDIKRLRGLFDLFVAVLERLCQIGAASRKDPGVTL